MICTLCNQSFPIKMLIDNKWRNLCNRKFCLECSPWGSHNTRTLLEKKTEVVGQKHCPKCNTIKLIEEFYKRKGSTNPGNYCKLCCTASTLERQRKLKAKAVEYLGGKCVDCNTIYHPAAYDFHHKDMAEKEFGIANSKLTSFDKIKDELDKCILLCANCHRIRHAKY